jgi:hypothetical protein
MIVLFNPRSTTPGKQPLPLSVLSLAAVLQGRHRWALVDGNLTNDPAGDIAALLSSASSSEVTLLGVTVMPGPQLSQAVPVCRDIRARVPHVPIVWGGYFPTQHADTVLASSYVDFVIRSQGEQPLLGLIEEIQQPGIKDSECGIRTPGVSWKDGRGKVVHNQTGAMIALDELPDLPYARAARERHLHASELGRGRTRGPTPRRGGEPT